MSSGTERLEHVTSLVSPQGVDLVGALSVEESDAAQPPGRRARELMPDCDTIVLFATGGPGGWMAATGNDGNGAPHRRRHPIDEWSRSIAGGVLEWLGSEGFSGRVVQPADAATLNFRQLAEMVGFGTISPILGHLLHPRYGPWVSLRAALLLAGHPFGERPAQPLNDFQPCTTCHRPCVSSCPAQTYDGAGAVHFDRCADHRIDGGCAHGCDSIGACPVGVEHRYGIEESAHRQAHALFAMQRWRGVGWWRFVPFGIRRRS